jgi:SRSO17 transposase
MANPVRPPTLAVTPNVAPSRQWGLPPRWPVVLANRFEAFCKHIAPCFQTKTRDGRAYGFAYLKSQLRLESARTFTGIAYGSQVPAQNMQHFMSNSPWSAAGAMELVQQDLRAMPALRQGSVLIVDEMADEKAGEHSAGAGLQYNGRLHRVGMSQVGVFVAYAHVGERLWTWVDGELYLLENWFDEAHAPLRHRLGIPEQRRFADKIELAWKVIQRLKARGLPFDLVACDDLYGSHKWFRLALIQAQILYMADVPSNTQVFLQPPQWEGHLETHYTVPVKHVVDLPDTLHQRITVRPTERGALSHEYFIRRVWTQLPDGIYAEWLIVRREDDGDLRYTLSNAPAETVVEQLAEWQCQRYFVERTNQDAKSELGFDDFCAPK